MHVNLLHQAYIYYASGRDTWWSYQNQVLRIFFQNATLFGVIVTLCYVAVVNSMQRL